MYCTRCGTQLESDSNFCSKCGTKSAFAQSASEQSKQTSQEQSFYEQPSYNQQSTQQEYTQPSEQKSKLVAGLLQIFLGWLGLGRFYLGYTGIAVAQLLVSVLTLGIGAIWPLIDGILILTGSVATDAKGVPLKD
ncbi:MAG: TM2 domain-containing protein [Dehalococcoidia bacterium]|nr:TM2 domain-containing protein [Dehalococcoidia bacterium]